MTQRDRSALDLTPPEPPHRAPRRLGLKPLLLGGVAGLGALGLLTYLLIGAGQQAAQQAETGKAIASANPGDLFVGMSGEIPARPTPVAFTLPDLPPRVTQAAQTTPAPAQAPAAPAEDDLTREARRRAWDRYFTQMDEVRQARYDAAKNALTAPTAVAEPGGGGGGMAAGAGRPGGAAAVAGIGGAGGAGGGRPGTMDLGPSTAANQYLEASVTEPLGQYELKRGDFIPCRTVHGINSEGQGMVKAIVADHVRDGANRIMIPEGAELVGVYDNQTGANQSGLAVGFTDIHFPPVGPDGRRDTLQLGSMPGTDGGGTALWRDQVDRHFWRRFNNAIIRAISGGGGSALAAAAGMGPAASFASAAGMEVSRTGQGLAASEEGSTIVIRPGYSCGLFLTRSIVFPGEWIEGVGFESFGQGWAR